MTFIPRPTQKKRKFEEDDDNNGRRDDLLPDDPLRMIMAYSEPAEAVNSFALVCRQWYNASTHAHKAPLGKQVCKLLFGEIRLSYPTENVSSVHEVESVDGVAINAAKGRLGEIDRMIEALKERRGEVIQHATRFAGDLALKKESQQQEFDAMHSKFLTWMALANDKKTIGITGAFKTNVLHDLLRREDHGNDSLMYVDSIYERIMDSEESGDITKEDLCTMFQEMMDANLGWIEF